MDAKATNQILNLVKVFLGATCEMIRDNPLMVLALGSEAVLSLHHSANLLIMLLAENDKEMRLLKPAVMLPLMDKISKCKIMTDEFYSSIFQEVEELCKNPDNWLEENTQTNLPKSSRIPPEFLN